MNENKSVDITINKEKDDIVIGDNDISIIAENGMRIVLPYEKAVIEKEDEHISFKKDGDKHIIEKKQI